MLRIFPLSQSWQVTVDKGEEVNGLPKLVLPEGRTVRLHFRYALLCFTILPGSTLNMATPFIFAVLTLD